MNKKHLQSNGIPASHYTKEYYFSHEFYHSAGEHDQFIKGGKPAYVYLRALSYIKQSKTATYLDIGCGKGELVIHLARLGTRAIGIDYAKAAIEICNDVLKTEKASVKKLVQFKVADATKLPFKDESIDAVFLLDVTEHLTKEETEKALNELKRVLKKGGKIIVHTNNKYFERGTKLLISFAYAGPKVFFNREHYLNDPPHPYEYMHINYTTPTWLAGRLKKLGFTTKIEYLMPKTKNEIKQHIQFNERWKQLILYDIVWVFLNSPFIKFLSPSFWLVGVK